MSSHKPTPGQLRGFDLKTHPRHPKTGQIIARNPYKLVVSQDPVAGSAKWLYERPVGSGIWYAPNGVIDKVASAEGLAKKEREEKDRSKSELDKAKAAYDAAKKAVEAAESAHVAELKAKNQPSKFEGR